MYSKRERLSLQRDKNNPLLKSECYRCGVRTYKQLIIETRTRSTQHQLDVTHRSMSSRAAEAFYYTFTDGLRLLTNGGNMHSSQRNSSGHSF